MDLRHMAIQGSLRISASAPSDVAPAHATTPAIATAPTPTSTPATANAPPPPPPPAPARWTLPNIFDGQPVAETNQHLDENGAPPAHDGANESHESRDIARSGDVTSDRPRPAPMMALPSLGIGLPSLGLGLPSPDLPSPDLPRLAAPGNPAPLRNPTTRYNSPIVVSPLYDTPLYCPDNYRSTSPSFAVDPFMRNPFSCSDLFPGVSEPEPPKLSEEELDEKLRLERESHDKLVKDFGVPWYPINSLPDVANNPSAYKPMLAYWEVEPRAANVESWMVYTMQWRRWKKFRAWQGRMRREHSKKLYKYYGRILALLKSQNFSQPFSLSEDPKLQNKAETWIEYMAYELMRLERYMWYTKHQGWYDEQWKDVYNRVLRPLDTDESIRNKDDCIRRWSWKALIEVEMEAMGTAMITAQRDLLDPTIPSNLAQRSLEKVHSQAAEIMNKYHVVEAACKHIDNYLTVTQSLIDAKKAAKRQANLVLWARAQFLPLQQECDKEAREAEEDDLRDELTALRALLDITGIALQGMDEVFDWAWEMTRPSDEPRPGVRRPGSNNPWSMPRNRAARDRALPYPQTVRCTCRPRRHRHHRDAYTPEAVMPYAPHTRLLRNLASFRSRSRDSSPAQELVPDLPPEEAGPRQWDFVYRMLDEYRSPRPPCSEVPDSGSVATPEEGSGFRDMSTVGFVTSRDDPVMEEVKRANREGIFAFYLPKFRPLSLTRRSVPPSRHLPMPAALVAQIEGPPLPKNWGEIYVREIKRFHDEGVARERREREAREAAASQQQEA